MSIVALLAALAAPAFGNFIDRMRVSTVSNELMASVQLVRAEAIQRNGMVRMIKITGTDCPAMPSKQFWNCGWRIFVDLDDDSIIDNGEEVIREFRITNGVNVVYSRNATNFLANRWGQVSGINAFSFTIQPASGSGGLSSTTTVCVNSGGRVRLIERSSVCP
jgi:type IV fimbrial biogenesis protein FimT